MHPAVAGVAFGDIEKWRLKEYKLGTRRCAGIGRMMDDLWDAGPSGIYFGGVFVLSWLFVLFGMVFVVLSVLGPVAAVVCGVALVVWVVVLSWGLLRHYGVKVWRKLFGAAEPSSPA